MNLIKNSKGIKKIIMKPSAITLCDLGNDWYKNELEIIFIPDKSYPDYTEIEKWIMENIDGKKLNIEDVVEKIYEFLKYTYSPKYLNVVDLVKGNKVHFDVIVEK